jgi:hypothetical protein
MGTDLSIYTESNHTTPPTDRRTFRPTGRPAPRGGGCCCGAPSPPPAGGGDGPFDERRRAAAESGASTSSSSAVSIPAARSRWPQAPATAARRFLLALPRDDGVEEDGWEEGWEGAIAAAAAAASGPSPSPSDARRGISCWACAFCDGLCVWYAFGA